MDGFTRFESCMLCNSKKLIALKGYEDNYLVRCKACGFVFCNRKPNEEELVEHYKNYPRGTSISPITIKRYNRLLDQFEQFRKTGNLLDVGCGDGYFLEVAIKRNWRVYGTEFTTEAVRICAAKGINMSLGNLHAAHYASNFFDVITSFEVIEHIQHPQNEIDGISKILRPGGVVYVTTPNFNSFSRDIIGPQWNIIEYPEHLSYYTRQTLDFLFTRNRFKLLTISTTGISFRRLALSRDAEGNRKNSDEGLREKIEESYLLNLIKTWINFILNFFGKGDSMKALFLKQ